MTMFSNYTFDSGNKEQPTNNNGAITSSNSSTSATTGGENKRKMIITPPSTSTASWESSSSDSLEKGGGEEEYDDDDPFERGRGKYNRSRRQDVDDGEEQSPMTVKRKPNPRKELSFTAEEERAVVRKFDKKVVVLMAVLYMLAFLDRSSMFPFFFFFGVHNTTHMITDKRSDIGNARIANMDSDLQSNPPNPQFYSHALSSFYLAYLLFEWMAILWRLIPAHIYVSVLVASWGVVACLQGIATSYPVLIVLRFLLGIGEAGFTGVPFYLSFFFKREELALRTAVFISGKPLSPPSSPQVGLRH